LHVDQCVSVNIEVEMPVSVGFRSTCNCMREVGGLYGL